MGEILVLTENGLVPFKPKAEVKPKNDGNKVEPKAKAVPKPNSDPTSGIITLRSDDESENTTESSPNISTSTNKDTYTSSKGRLEVSTGYVGEIPTPISLSGHGLFAEGRFRYNHKTHGYIWGLNFTGTWPNFKISATDKASKVEGFSRSYNFVFGTSKLKPSRFTTGTSYLIGLGETGHSSFTRNVGGEDIELPSNSVKAFHIGTRYHADLKLHDKFSLGAFFMLGSINAEGEDFDRISLAAGINANLNLDILSKGNFSKDSKQKPSNLLLSHILAGKLTSSVQQYYTGKLNDQYEVILNSGLISGTQEPGALADLVLLKSLTAASAMMASGASMNNFLAMNDKRRWIILGAEGAVGAGFLFSKGSGGKAHGVANLANASRMFIFNAISTDSKRNSMSEDEKKKKFRFAYTLSGGVNLLTGVLSTFVIAKGDNNRFANGMLNGSTIAQGGNVFFDVPDIKSKLTVAYSPAMYQVGGQDGSGWLGAVVIGKDFKGTNLGAEVTIASPMLRGDKPYERFDSGVAFSGTSLPSMVCAAPGYKKDLGKHLSIFGGPEQCIRLGGSDLRAGSLGAKGSLWGKLPLSFLNKSNFKVLAGASAGLGWSFGNVAGENSVSNTNNGAYFNFTPMVGLSYEEK